jgi:hypothetical protein
MTHRVTPAPNDVIFYGTLGPETRGCLDIHDHDTPCYHTCTGAVGLVSGNALTADEDSGPPGAQWQIGSTVRLVRYCGPEGDYPYCLLIAEYADVLDEIEAAMGDSPEFTPPNQRDPRAPFFHWAPLTEEPLSASFQWKGASIDLTFTCPVCEANLHAEGEFAYHVACPRCRTAFAVDWHVPVERVS